MVKVSVYLTRHVFVIYVATSDHGVPGPTGENHCTVLQELIYHSFIEFPPVGTKEINVGFLMWVEIKMTFMYALLQIMQFSDVTCCIDTQTTSILG